MKRWIILGLLAAACGGTPRLPQSVSSADRDVHPSVRPSAVDVAPTTVPAAPCPAPCAPLLLDAVPPWLAQAAPARGGPPNGALRRLWVGGYWYTSRYPVQLFFRDAALEILDMTTGTLRNAASGEEVRKPTEHDGNDVTMAPNGDWLARGCDGTTFYHRGRRVGALSRGSRRTRRGAPAGGTLVRYDAKHCVAFDRAGQRAIMVFRDKTTARVALSDRRVRVDHQYEGLECSQRSVSLSHDGERFACGIGSQVAVVSIDGASVRRYPLDAKPQALAFFDDAKSLAVALPGEIQVLNVNDGEVSARFLTGHSDVRALSTSPDGEWIAIAGSGLVSVWQRSSGRPVPIRRGHSDVPYSVLVSNDGQIVVSASQQEVLVWKATADWLPEPLMSMDATELKAVPGRTPRFFCPSFGPPLPFPFYDPRRCPMVWVNRARPLVQQAARTGQAAAGVERVVLRDELDGAAARQGARGGQRARADGAGPGGSAPVGASPQPA